MKITIMLIGLLLLSYSMTARTFATFSIGASNSTNPKLSGRAVLMPGSYNFSPTLCGKIALGAQIKRWQIGGSVFVSKMSDNTKNGTVKYIYAAPLAAIEATVNRTIFAGLYLGVSGGSAIPFVTPGVDRNGDKYKITESVKAGFCYGGQAGYNLKLKKDFALNIEGGLRQVQNAGGYSTDIYGNTIKLGNYKYLYYYLTAGIKITL